MNKLLTIIICSAFFVVEAIGISVFLLDISLSSIEAIVPWVLGGSLNLAFLVILLFTIFSKE